MANLGRFTIDTNGEYKQLSEVTGVNFVPLTKYIIQCLTPAILCEKGTTPDNEGFYVSNDAPVQYTATSNPLWIKSCHKDNGESGSIINIAE